MSFMLRAAILVAATAFTFGCKPKPVAAEEPAPASEAEAPAAPVAAKIEACRLQMTAPDAHEWTTYWDPAGIRNAGEGPSFVRSPVWGNAQEREIMSRGRGSQLDITCGAKDAQGDLEFAIGLDAFDSTEKDIPMGPGTYPVTPKSPDAKVKPGTFIAGTILYDKSMFTATGGTVKIDRFDMNGVAGSFVVEGHEILMGSRPFHVEGKFDIPCRGGMLEGACTANKAAKRE